MAAPARELSTAELLAQLADFVDFTVEPTRLSRNQIYLSRNIERIGVELAAPFKLSKLHIATICGDVDNVAECLRTGEKFVRDQRGWLPIHHLALLPPSPRHNQILELFKSRFPDCLTMKTIQGDRYEDFITRTTMVFVAPETPIPLFIDSEMREDGKAEEGKRPAAPPSASTLTQLTAGRFRSLTSIPYGMDMRSTREFELDVWVNGISTPPRIPEQFTRIHKHLTDQSKKFDPAKSPPLILRRGLEGISVYPKVPARPGEFIGLYTGLLCEEEAFNLYNLGKCNPTSYGNAMALLNDGLPNVVTYGCDEWNTYMHTLCAVGPATQFVWNYGAKHPIKLMLPRQELNRAETFEFVQRELPNLVTEQYSDVLPTKRPPNVQAEWVVLHNDLKLNYVLCTPSIIFEMFLENQLSLKTSAALFNLANKLGKIVVEFSHIVADQKLNIVLSMPGMMQTNSNVRFVLKAYNIEAEALYLNYLKSLVSRFGLVTGLHLMQKADEFFKNECQSIKTMKNPEESTPAKSALVERWKAFYTATLLPMEENYMKHLAAFNKQMAINK